MAGACRGRLQRPQGVGLITLVEAPSPAAPTSARRARGSTVAPRSRPPTRRSSPTRGEDEGQASCHAGMAVSARRHRGVGRERGPEDRGDAADAAQAREPAQEAPRWRRRLPRRRPRGPKSRRRGRLEHAQHVVKALGPAGSDQERGLAAAPAMATSQAGRERLVAAQSRRSRARGAAAPPCRRRRSRPGISHFHTAALSYSGAARSRSRGGVGGGVAHRRPPKLATAPPASSAAPAPAAARHIEPQVARGRDRSAAGRRPRARSSCSSTSPRSTACRPSGLDHA